MVLMTKAEGNSKIKENIFENRFMHVSELKKNGSAYRNAWKKAKFMERRNLMAQN